ncbi:MAG TPA: hypothetical protein VIJ95_14580 [Hanamia sp.]
MISIVIIEQKEDFFTLKNTWYSFINNKIFLSLILCCFFFISASGQPTLPPSYHIAADTAAYILLPDSNWQLMADRGGKKYKAPPPTVMMITAYGDAYNYNQAMSLGADDFLTKPLDFTALKEKLKTKE